MGKNKLPIIQQLINAAIIGFFGAKLVLTYLIDDRAQLDYICIITAIWCAGIWWLQLTVKPKKTQIPNNSCDCNKDANIRNEVLAHDFDSETQIGKQQ